MVASQRFPDYFDGIVAGALGFNLPRAAVAEAWNEQALAPLATRLDANGQPYLPDTFSDADLLLIRNATLAACDGLDGLADGLVDNNNRACRRSRWSVLHSSQTRPHEHRPDPPTPPPFGTACPTACLFSANDTIRWYDAVDRRERGDAAGFARLFLVPGMGHCSGGPATTFSPLLYAGDEQAGDDRGEASR